MSKTVDDYKNGQVLLIDKPLNWTSFQVVNKLRWHIRKHFDIKKIKVGHAGTLDPLATGLLIICTGKQTKNIETYQGQLKEYTGTFVLGATTPSYDLETEVDETYPTDHITEDLIHDTTKQFTGKIQQKPPIFSAIKKDGKRLYELAREGKTTEIKSREIEIFEFEITKISMPNVEFRVVCSKGTYIRSLAHDFGQALSSGAHLSVLRRTKIGDYSVANAQSIEGFVEALV
ncbi:tRNA pseudouridine(55) synthase TruB [Tenacibaculum sp. M341]|uniref:tRNA pseudouridine(55) synthase TruB n=1 Tax=Tenacibaculum sp. M341 TaxID=2530339 RepID=UPI001046C85C|nr:tRNA pseudouridine(55) synthase TruB [Tenacibaculum sp. M341]TCI93144.1 tRNA pseudouridine(55) synthase TruB [Tenacibaculum sp. M341]